MLRSLAVLSFLEAKMLKTESSLKAAGMESCAARYRDQLLKAQRIAVDCARAKGTVTSDDVREEAERRGMVLNFSKNWSGSVFRGKDWELVGHVRSRHTGSHGRFIGSWRLRNQPKAPMAVPVQKIEPKPVFKETLFDLPKNINYEY